MPRSRYAVLTTRPAGPKEVILTGTFDNWAKTLYLVKQVDGLFELVVPLPPLDGPLLYKYVVDGDWVVNRNEKIGTDASGIENNVLHKSDLVSVSSSGVKIPESGGLLVTPATAASGDVKTTVMPQEELLQPSVSGEAGIHIPTDPKALAAFETVRDVDPKTLNEPELTPEEKKKQKKKVKRSEYKKKKKALKASANGTAVSEDTLEHSPEPEAVAAAVAAINTPVDTIEKNARPEAHSAVEEKTLVPGTTEAETLAAAPVEPAAENHDEAHNGTVATGLGAAALVGGAGLAASDAVHHTEAPKTLDPAAHIDDQAPASASVTATEPVVSPVTQEKPHVAEAIPEPTVEAEPVSKSTEEAHAPVDIAKESPVEPAPVAAAVVPAVAVATGSESLSEPVPETVPHTSEAAPQHAAEVSDVKADDAAPAVVAAPLEKEVDAAPVKPKYEEDEIIIAQGGANATNIEELVAAQHGDVTVEEIKPTDSEAQRLTKEANLATQGAKDAPNTAATGTKTAPAAKPSATKTTPSTTGKKEKKGFLSKLKKIFK